MGRDDARTVAGLQGGTAPARAFHDFMAVAVAHRPVEQFDTQVPIPDWQLTPEEEIYGDTTVDANAIQSMVDENGMPIVMPPQEQGYPPQQPMVRPDGTGDPTQQDLDRAFPPQQPQSPQRSPQPPYPQQRQPQPVPPPRPGNEQSNPPADPSQPRPYTS
jgi:penicillin-binding protein 1A